VPVDEVAGTRVGEPLDRPPADLDQLVLGLQEIEREHPGRPGHGGREQERGTQERVEPVDEPRRPAVFGNELPYLGKADLRTDASVSHGRPACHGPASGDTQVTARSSAAYAG
jgi:hypothetical protein